MKALGFNFIFTNNFELLQLGSTLHFMRIIAQFQEQQGQNVTQFGRNTKPIPKTRPTLHTAIKGAINFNVFRGKGCQTYQGNLFNSIAVQGQNLTFQQQKDYTFFLGVRGATN